MIWTPEKVVKKAEKAEKAVMVTTVCRPGVLSVNHHAPVSAPSVVVMVRENATRRYATAKIGVVFVKIIIATISAVLVQRRIQISVVELLWNVFAKGRHAIHSVRHHQIQVPEVNIVSGVTNVDRSPRTPKRVNVHVNQIHSVVKTQMIVPVGKILSVVT